MDHLSKRTDVFGFLRPAIDAHTLGISSLAELLRDAGINVVVADEVVCRAAANPEIPPSAVVIVDWIRRQKITRLGFSYRLDPADGAQVFGRLVHMLRRQGMLNAGGGPLRSLYYAGLPDACARVERDHGSLVGIFAGDESPMRTFEILGINPALLPDSVRREVAYDKERLDFGRRLLESEVHRMIKPVPRGGYEGYGTRSDRLLSRLDRGRATGTLPLIRAHVGPYSAEARAAVNEFLDWVSRLANSGWLDILSIGTSQLTQSHFGKDWAGMPNGGGVPINSADEYRAVWNSARPMLVRTYAGTDRMSELAALYEETLNNAWHTFSFWWFSELDGRGPKPLRENLEMHFETLKLVADFNKPFEPNVPHHFAFRGADDVTYVVSGVLAARAAKRHGIRNLILQVMLNTPKFTSGIQDLAKARALVHLVRKLEDDSFRVFVQPRAGLDFFSSDMEEARVQLAAVSALMDDLEPHRNDSPEIVHVVSFSEGSHLATPEIVDESVRITRAAIETYRRERIAGNVRDMRSDSDVNTRFERLTVEASIVLSAIESWVTDPYSAAGFHRIFSAGFLPVPHLWGRREQFPDAWNWTTRSIEGGVRLVDEKGLSLSVEARLDRVKENLIRSGQLGVSKP